MSAVRTSAVVAGRNLRATVSSPATLLPPPAASLTMLAALAGGLGALGSLPGFSFPGGYTGFQAVNIGLISAAFGGVLAGLALAEDYETGVAQRLLLAPTSRGSVLAGYVAAGAARGVATAVVVVAVASATGVPVPGLWRALAVAGLWLLVAVATGLWSVGIAIRRKAVAAGPLMQLPVFLAMFLGPVLTPAELQSGWLRRAGSANPLSWVLEASRSLFAGGSSRALQALAGMVCCLAVLCAWTASGVRQAGSPAGG